MFGHKWDRLPVTISNENCWFVSIVEFDKWQKYGKFIDVFLCVLYYCENSTLSFHLSHEIFKANKFFVVIAFHLNFKCFICSLTKKRERVNAFLVLPLCTTKRVYTAAMSLCLFCVGVVSNIFLLHIFFFRLCAYCFCLVGFPIGFFVPRFSVIFSFAP